MELFGQLDDKRTDKRTDGLTELFLKLLSRPKIKNGVFKVCGIRFKDSFLFSVYKRVGVNSNFEMNTNTKKKKFLL